MPIQRLSLAVAAILSFALISAGDPPALPAKGPPPREAVLPVGEWSIEFANGVIETCEIRKDGTASESEPNRKSDGKAVAKDGAIVIAFDDDRTERWTAVGKRMVVEHWFPSAKFPCGTPVLGIADRER
jgi:hypothetical protein